MLETKDFGTYKTYSNSICLLHQGNNTQTTAVNKEDVNVTVIFYLWNKVKVSTFTTSIL